MKTIKLFAVLLPVWLFGGAVYAQWSFDMQQDRHIASSFFAQVKAEEEGLMGAIIVKAALFFVHTPYVGHTLEVGDMEQLVVNLRELDCTTFMETCVALSRAVGKGTPDFDSYCRELQYIRYRGGVLDGYTSRLHYTSDWIFDNVGKGVVEDVTQQAGGRPLPLQLSFMSSHSDAYKHLKGRPDRVAYMQEVEKRINARDDYYYIPKQEIEKNRNHIRSGDLICFTTSMEGMDISHVGIAYWQEDVLTFIHASSTAKKVVVNEESISEYCSGIKSNTGIMVLRCNEEGLHKE